MRRIFHLELKEDNSHKYYGSLSALVEENTDMFTIVGQSVEFAKLVEAKFLTVRKN